MNQTLEQRIEHILNTFENTLAKPEQKELSSDVKEKEQSSTPDFLENPGVVDVTEGKKGIDGIFTIIDNKGNKKEENIILGRKQ